MRYNHCIEDFQKREQCSLASLRGNLLWSNLQLQQYLIKHLISFYSIDSALIAKTLSIYIPTINEDRPSNGPYLIKRTLLH